LVDATSTRSYRAIAIVIAGILISASLYVAVEAPTTTTTTTTKANLPPVSPCQSFLWNESSLGSPSGFPVLLMRPNSTGYICVTYQTAFDFNLFSVQNPTQFRPFEIGGLCSRSNGVATCASSDSHSFVNAVTPNSLTLSGNNTFFTVIYIVTALGNSTRFHNYGGIGPGCEEEAMAAGFSA
jgi:hypothetical protein